MAKIGLSEFVGRYVTLKFAVADIGFDEETGCLEEVTEDYVRLRSEYGDEIYLVGVAVYKIVVHRDCGGVKRSRRPGAFGG